MKWYHIKVPTITKNASPPIASLQVNLFFHNLQPQISPRPHSIPTPNCNQPTQSHNHPVKLHPIPSTRRTLINPSSTRRRFHRRSRNRWRRSRRWRHQARPIWCRRIHSSRIKTPSSKWIRRIGTSAHYPRPRGTRHALDGHGEGSGARANHDVPRGRREVGNGSVEGERRGVVCEGGLRDGEGVNACW